MAEKKKKYEFVQIMALDGNTIYRSKELTALKDGKTNPHAFGRIGCFFAGCCYGKETDSFLGVPFPHLDSPVHPTQLYEAAFLLDVCRLLVPIAGKRF